MKRALILGGSRFIGYHLSEKLLRLGIRISHFRRGETPPPAAFSSSIETFWGNRDYPTDLQQVFRNSYDFVFDLSGHSPEHVAPFTTTYRSKIGHYLFCSTPSVIRLPAPIPHTENSSGITDHSYGGRKRAAELLLLETREKTGLPVTVFRPQGVLGKYDGAHANQAFLLLKNKKPVQVRSAVLNSKLNLLDVRDLVCAFTTAAMEPKSFGNIYNLANSEPVSFIEFLHTCSEISGKAVPRIEVSENATVCKWWHDYDLIADTTRVRQDLALQFTPLYETIESIWKDFKHTQVRKALSTHIKKLLVRFR